MFSLNLEVNELKLRPEFSEINFFFFHSFSTLKMTNAGYTAVIFYRNWFFNPSNDNVQLHGLSAN